MIRYGSLFSGVGLLDLGVERAFEDAGVDLACAFQIEKDAFCRDVLGKHWPGVVRHEDVTRAGSTGAALASVDLLVGGFPCQDISEAGRGRGLRGGDRSWLWFEYLRLIEELAPRAVLIENVRGLVWRGLDDVVAGLDRLGYAVEASRIRASDVGAPHRRERLFLVAYARGARSQGHDQHEPERPVAARRGRRVADADGLGQLEHGGREREGGRRTRDRRTHGRGRDAVAPESVAAPVARVGRVLDGRAPWLDAHRWPAPPGPAFAWEPPRTEANVVNRPARLRALGNAVVPQCAYVAARRVIEVAGWAKEGKAA